SSARHSIYRRCGPASRRSTTRSPRGCRPGCCSTSRRCSNTRSPGYCATTGSSLAPRSRGWGRARARSPRRWPICCRRATAASSRNVRPSLPRRGFRKHWRGAPPLERAARAYYGAGDRVALDDMRAAAQRLPAETAWQKQAVETVIDDSFALQAEFSERALRDGADGADPVATWAASRGAALAPAEASVTELRAATAPDLAMLVVAGRQLRQTLG